MKFSVWRPELFKYDVFETAVQTDAPPQPTHLPRSGPLGLGIAPEEAAYPLPLDARWVGQSDIPVGCIAATKGGISALSGTIANLSPLGKLAAAGTAVLGLLWWRKRRRKR